MRFQRKIFSCYTFFIRLIPNPSPKEKGEACKVLSFREDLGEALVNFIPVFQTSALSVQSGLVKKIGL